MRNYLQTTIEGLTHLGAPTYDSDDGDYDPPAVALCGVSASEWSSTLVEPGTWAQKATSTVCPSCDRAAMWQAIVSLGIK